MFDNLDRIEWLDRDEYRQAMYWFQHPDEYEGDYVAFRDKMIAYGERLRSGEALAEHYRKIIAEKKEGYETEKQTR